MANGKFERGEMYWFRWGDSVGSEQSAGRPGVVISCNKGNDTSPTLLIAMVTRQTKYMSIDVKTMVGGLTRWVLCNQIMAVDKIRAGNFIGTLSKEEMQALDTALEEALDLGYVDDTKNKEIEAQAAEIGTLKAKITENEDIVSSMKMEIEMWKKCYDRAMDMLVQTKVSADYSLRAAKVAEPEQPNVEESPVVEESESEPERVEINTCAAEDLKRCGCTEVVAKTIIAGRPYMKVDDLRRIPGITSVGFGILKHKVCCVPVKVEEPEQKTEESVVVVEAEEPVKVVLDDKSTLEQPVVEKVNINTATAKEIAEHLGIGRLYPSRIVTHRNKNGKFVDLEELKMVEGLSKKFYDQHKDRLTIGEEEQPEEEPVEPEVATEKVNINTASAGDLHVKLGLSMTVCYSITGVRKRNGLYKSIEELREVPRFTEFHWEKYKDMLTVGEIDSEDDDESSEEPKSDKVNINTASLRELMDVGFEKRAAALIVNERKKFGRFRSVDDLAGIPEITGKILRKLRDKLEV